MKQTSLRYSIGIYEATVVKESTYGSQDVTYALLYNTRAMVRYIPGREMIQNETVVAGTAAVFTVRYRDTVDEACRILYDGAFWNIKSIEKDRYDMYMMLTASKIQN